MLGDDFLDDVVNDGIITVDDLIGLLVGVHEAFLDEKGGDERTEKLDGHLAWETALVHLEGWTDGDDGTAGVVDTFAKEVLTETALLAFESAREGLKWAAIWTGDRFVSATVVDKGVHRFLKHTLLVHENDVWGVHVDELLETGVTGDDTAIEIVEVARGETATVELKHRTEIRWDDWDDVENHPFWLLFGIAEGLDDLKSLGGFESVLAARGSDDVADFFESLIKVDFVEKLLDGGSAFAEFGAGVLGDEGGSGEEVEGLVSVADLFDELFGLHDIAWPPFGVDAVLEGLDAGDELLSRGSLIEEVFLLEDG